MLHWSTHYVLVNYTAQLRGKGISLRKSHHLLSISVAISPRQQSDSQPDDGNNGFPLAKAQTVCRLQCVGVYRHKGKLRI